MTNNLIEALEKAYEVEQAIFEEIPFAPGTMAARDVARFRKQAIARKLAALRALGDDDEG